MVTPITLAERPDHPGLADLDVAVAALSDAVAALRAAEQLVQDRKAALTPAIPKIDDPDLAKRLAVWIYWNMPEVPVAPLAEMATGLTAGRAQQAFFKLSGTRASAVSCGACGKPVAVASRDEMKRVLIAKLKRGVLPICEVCRADRRPETPSVYVERPVRNTPPSAFERDVLILHAERGEPKTIEALCLWGMQRVELLPAHIRLYLSDADLGVAAALNTSREDYLEWLEGWGSVRCSGTTATGDRCLHSAKGMTSLELGEWLTARAKCGYCAVHGG
jgi:hypothetical protein